MHSMTSNPSEGYCDLHCHSTASDGTVRPREVVRIAHRTGLRAIALTDHDTLDGVADAADEARHLGIEFIPGCEISLDEAPGTFHVVGLLIDPANAVLKERLDFVRRGREERNAGIAEKLTALGIPVTVEQAAAEAGGDVVGRPHFARILVARKIVKDFREAFDRFLGKDKPAYVDRDRLPMADAMAAIHGAGGVAVLAHPYTIGLHDPAEFEKWLRGMAEQGLDAIETEYTEHSARDVAHYRALARRCGLLESGGSDFHGENKKNTEIGIGKGGLRVPYAFLQAMKDRVRSRGVGGKA
jgi:predicted metal-dependent phosphoesterase TrpH